MFTRLSFILVFFCMQSSSIHFYCLRGFHPQGFYFYNLGGFALEVVIFITDEGFTLKVFIIITFEVSPSRLILLPSRFRPQGCYCYLRGFALKAFYCLLGIFRACWCVDFCLTWLVPACFCYLYVLPLK